MKEIDLPVFVTCGRYDETTPSHLEEPDAYFEAVETFLAPAESSG